jgi:hypothetical protein
MLWRGGRPEEKAIKELTEQVRSAEELDFALAVLEQLIAHDDEQGPDPVVQRIDAAVARGENVVPIAEEEDR